MKKTSGLWVLALVLAVMLAACGGGGGGGDDVVSPPPATTVPDGTFLKTVETGTTNGITPFGAILYIHEQHLVLASDINGAGYIQSLSLQLYSNLPSAVTCTSVTVKMGHTLVTGLTTTFASNVEQGKGSLVTVRNPAAFTAPAGNAGDYFTINLDTPFYYNGVDNLVTEFIQDGGCGTSVTLNSGSVTNSTLFSVTDGSATGTLLNSYLNMRFHFKGGTNTVIAQNQTGDASSNMAPGQKGRTQMLILASDVAGKGLITGMAIQPGTTTVGGTFGGVSVVLSHTTSTNLGTDFAMNSANSASATTVVSNLTYTIPNGMPSPVWIPFNAGSFNYDGSSNIFVDVIVSSASMTYSIDIKHVPAARTVTNNDPSAATGTLHGGSLQPVFRFKGGTMDVIGASDSGAEVFASVNIGQQFLLRAAELGTAGSISRLACRAYANTTDASYPDFTVTLAHTTQNALVANDATNIAGGTMVYSGTFNMPAGLLKGDWVEIPFSTSFNYNGVDNLVVQTTTSAGTTAQYCQISGPDATRFAGSRKITGGSPPSNDRGTFRFWVNK